MNSSDLPMVSVVIPCLNRAHYLKPTIESVLQQDYPNIECIVVDGGSTDGSIDVLKEYGNRLKWVSEPDKGHADAINKGWRMSHGEILAWLNADDMWIIPDSVRKAATFLLEHPDVDVVYGDCTSVDANGNAVGFSYCHDWDLSYAVEHCDHCIPQPASFIRRSILERVEWLDTALYIKDRELWLRIGLQGRIQYIPVLLAQERNLPGLSSDGPVSAESCVQVTRKFFSLPDVPEAILRKKNRAMSNSYLRAMDYAWEGGRHTGLVFLYALKALFADLSNAKNAYRRLRRYVWSGIGERRMSPWMLLALDLPLYPYRILNGIYHSIRDGRARFPNLEGYLDMEWSWVSAHLPAGSGKALDAGSGGTLLALAAVERGFQVTTLVSGDRPWHYSHARIRIIEADLMNLDMRGENYDLILVCSSDKGPSLVARRGLSEDHSGEDLRFMETLRKLLKPGGSLMLTLPLGVDGTFPPFCRVYGSQRLPQLFRNYAVEAEGYWVKDSANRWMQSGRDAAVQFQPVVTSDDPQKNAYALGCFVLKRPC